MGWTPIEGETTRWIVNGSGNAVCLCGTNATDADWLLLKAAPELLEALRAAVAEEEPFSDISPVKPWIVQARSAISRAEGGSDA